jgi:uncharacterized protein (TIGR00369 family)
VNTSPQSETSTDIPDGYRPMNVPEGKFLAENGPIYGWQDGDDIHLGMRIGEQHTNAGGICHGGMSMAFADAQLVAGAMAKMDDYTPLATINTCVDFVRPGIVGGWFRGETKIIRSTRNLVFAEAMIFVDDELAMRCSGVLRRLKFEPFDPDLMFQDIAPGYVGLRGESDPPEGFHLANIPGPVLDINGPLHVHLEDRNLRLGLRIEERHCNSSGVCHGGILMMFADVQQGVGTMFKAEEFNFMPTMHMSTDFAVPVRVGSWLVGETEVIRMTRNMAFSSCILSVDGVPVVRSSGVNKRTSKSFDVATPKTIFDLPV